MPTAYSHQPSGYRCPFCRVAAGEDLRDDFTKQSDVVFRDDRVTAFISSAWWPANAGHVLVVPNQHHENVYAIPDDLLAAVQVAGKRVALAIRETYDCDGTSFRQHNEPGGNQEVWHYHLHVFPRRRGDELYARSRERRYTTPAERAPYAQRLRGRLLAADHEPYASLAEHYDLIYADWPASIRRQGAALDRLIRAELGEGRFSVLDASCGIGTQALGLAQLGHRVHGTDLSPAEVGRARREAARRGVAATFGVADMRALATDLDGRFDVVISADNSIAHLLTEADLALALGGMRARLRDGGLLVVTLRDYDAMLAERPRSSTPTVVDDRDGRRVVLHVFDWDDGAETYRTSIFILREVAGRWSTLHWSARSRAWRRGQVERALEEAGFARWRWSTPDQSGFFQPLVTARPG